MASTVHKTNWFAIWVTIIAVVALVAVAAVVIVINNKSSEPGAEPTGSIIDTKNGAVTFGDAKTNTIDTYVDFLCPFCNQFEQASGSTIKGLVDSGKVTLRVHPVTILDSRSVPAGYSSRAAGAFFAVAAADPDHAYAFMEGLFANQPEEGKPGLTDEQLIEVAKNAGVTMTGDLQKAIMSNTYQKFALSHDLPQGATGTPTVLVNGKDVHVLPPYDPQKYILPNLS